MTFTKDEQCAIIYTSLMVAHADDDFSYSEQRHIAKIGLNIGYEAEDIHKVNKLNSTSAMAILKKMSKEKKEEARKLLQSVAEADGRVQDSEFYTIIKLLSDMHDLY